MCQQWIAILGLVLDIAGFLILAREWYWAINLQGAEQVERRMGNEDTAADRKYRWDGWLAQYKLRRGIFRIGLGLIVAGFVGQLIGSLPASYAAHIGLKSCN